MPASDPCQSALCIDLPACHRCARPDRLTCSAHTSSCAGPSSPPMRHRRAAGSPSLDPGCTAACIVIPRFPGARTLDALSQGAPRQAPSSVRAPEVRARPSLLFPAFPTSLAIKTVRYSLAVCSNKSIYLGGVYENLFPFCSGVEI